MTLTSGARRVVAGLLVIAVVSGIHVAAAQDSDVPVTPEASHESEVSADETGIVIGRTGFFLDRTLEGARLLSGNRPGSTAPDSDEALQLFPALIREAALYDRYRAALCDNDILSGKICEPAELPKWANAPQTAAPSLHDLAEWANDMQDRAAELCSAIGRRLQETGRHSDEAEFLCATK